MCDNLLHVYQMCMILNLLLLNLKMKKYMHGVRVDMLLQIRWELFLVMIHLSNEEFYQYNYSFSIVALL